jgi:hypothetical protein
VEKSILKILDLRGRELREDGEDCVVKSFIIFAPLQVL